jgi:hypothetical protein
VNLWLTFSSASFAVKSSYNAAKLLIKVVKIALLSGDDVLKALSAL